MEAWSSHKLSLTKCGTTLPKQNPTWKKSDFREGAREPEPSKALFAPPNPEKLRDTRSSNFPVEPINSLFVSSWFKLHLCHLHPELSGNSHPNGGIQMVEPTGWKRKEVCQGCIFSPCFFYLWCRVHHTKCHEKQESRLPGEISTTSDRQMIPPLWQKAKRN